MRDFNRNSRFDNRRGGGRPEMHRAICDECGESCEVPFKPTGNKPIYCSKCFENQGGSSSRRDNSRHDNSRRNGRDFSRGNSREREMFSAICDECGEKCEIPFKPSSDKPVFCSTCFSKRDGQVRFDKGNSRREIKSSEINNDFRQEFKVINEKLDKILQTLSPVLSKTIVVKSAATIVPRKKVVVKKIVAKKKAIKKVKAKIVKKAIKKLVKKKKK